MRGMRRGIFACLWKGLLIAGFLVPGINGWADPAAMSPASPGSPMAFPFSSDSDMSKDFQALAPPYLPWGPNTSGPFFTGTAEVEPIGSWYLEPFAYDYITPGSRKDH